MNLHCLRAVQCQSVMTPKYRRESFLERIERLWMRESGPSESTIDLNRVYDKVCSKGLLRLLPAQMVVSVCICILRPVVLC